MEVQHLVVRLGSWADVLMEIVKGIEMIYSGSFAGFHHMDEM
jgi:hypothetical protein